MVDNYNLMDLLENYIDTDNVITDIINDIKQLNTENTIQGVKLA